MPTPTILERLGGKIREQRALKKYSQEELAFRSGIHRAYIGSIERGEENVTMLTLEKIARALEVKVSDLIDG
ncbi:helix-turn-helix transcriptional regulator [uncultured Imperialibacter sp.]|uniref:helix-turn-helix domain-containing protein n=1 Tax=Imperialibacter sp. TaxID=2038411 RepID=UPI0030DBE1E7|tara:strand:- start:1057 stop:1272 length:216 start_codon:yes stop_codon:yes gene_type:complete